MFAYAQGFAYALIPNPIFSSINFPHPKSLSWLISSTHDWFPSLSNHIHPPPSMSAAIQSSPYGGHVRRTPCFLITSFWEAARCRRRGRCNQTLGKICSNQARHQTLSGPRPPGLKGIWGVRVTSKFLDKKESWREWEITWIKTEGEVWCN